MSDDSEIFSVYILKSQATAMLAAENYLKNRGCSVASSANLKEALAHIIQKKPQYVLITADHHNKKVSSLPKLLNQIFPIHIIGFAEKSGSLSMQTLNGMGLEYLLFAPVSGPAIQRIIRKIKNDGRLTPLEAAKNSSAKNAAASNDLITFKGDSQAREALNQLLLGADEKEESSGIAYNPEQQQPGESFEAWAARMREAANNESKSFAGPASQGFEFTDAKEKSGGEYEFNQDAEANHKTNKNPIFESEYIRKENKNYSFSSDKASGFQRSDSIIVQGTQTALEESITITAGTVQKIENSSNMACINIKSQRFSGFLVCALGQNRKVDDTLIKSIQKKLYDFLKANGEAVSPEDTLEIQLQEVEFENWAFDQAEFLKKSIHNGNEIAMAFFPAQNLSIKLEDSAEENMYKLTIDDLKPNTPTEFDLYIYMPENQKYILYTPQGKSLQSIQKDRLKEKGITHLHLKKDSAQQVKKYQAQNYLNDRIDDFKKTSNIKKSGS